MTLQQQYAQWQTNRYLQSDPFAYAQAQTAYQWPQVYTHHRCPMIAADLGLVDELLDDKIGMEPNPLDGTRLWDNS